MTRHPGQALLPFDAVWRTIEAAVTPLDSRTTPLETADRLVLRSDARAAWDLPRDDNSAMDGFAIRAADATSTPVSLRLAEGDAYAGTSAIATVAAGTALPIGTGGVVPPGADAIVPKENCRCTENLVEVLEPAHPGDHIRRRGEELRAGAVVVPAGDRLDPLRMAALATAGVTEVEVGARPRVRVLTSGDEVVPIGTPPARGGVVDSNSLFLRLAIERLVGAVCPSATPIRDDRPSVVNALGSALDGADIVVVTGGVSVGDRDLIKPVLEEDLGVERLLWRVAQKPGKPTYVGRRGATWVVGLPGNPAAVAAMWFVMVRPLLLALQGAAECFPRRFEVALSVSVQPNRNRLWLRWCRLGHGPDGILTADPLARSGSHMLSDFAHADGLVLVPPGDRVLPAGTRLEALRLDR